jgi:hypothetical protein
MPVTVEWLNEEKNILHHHFETPWGWDNFYESAERHLQLIQEAPDVVDLVLDFSKGSVMPSGAITHFRWALRQHTPNRGLVVIIGVTPFMAALGDVFRKLYPNIADDARIADDLLEALAIINDHRRTQTAVEAAS